MNSSGAPSARRRGAAAAPYAAFGAFALLLSGCQAQKAGGAPPDRSAAAVSWSEAAPATSVDGATLVLTRSGERLYFSSRLATFLSRVERGDVFRRLIGREVALEGAFLATDGAVQRGGIAAATTAGHEGGVAIAYIRTYPGEDRVVDFHAREREMRAISLVGVGDHISCMATGWVSSKQAVFSRSDFVQEPCRLLQGRLIRIE